MPSFGQTAIPAVYFRGGTSKAIFLQEKDIPAPGRLRDRVLKRVMGAPDQIQIDGMGGSRVVTSKIAIVSPSKREDADVDYTFAQIGIGSDSVDYSGNCGNISAAVAPFAIDEGLIQKPFRKGHCPDKRLAAREVRIWQTGTQKILIAHVPVDERTGLSISSGMHEIAGVPGSAAPILMDFRRTTGASRNRGILPTKNAIDVFNISGKNCEATICDVANICVFVRAADLGVTGRETALELDENRNLIRKAKELRGKAAQKVGMCQDWEKVDIQSPTLPMVVLVSPVLDRDQREADVTLRLLLKNTCHDSMAGTGGTCAAACSRISGSVVDKVLRDHELKDNILRIQHPLGVMPISVHVSQGSRDPLREGQDDGSFDVLAFTRTARRIMDGQVYVPSEIWEGTRNRS